MRPLSNDLQEFIRLLNRHGVKYVIVGAWALAFHGRPRYTGDVDFFVPRDPKNATALMEVLQAFGFGSAGIEHGDFLKADHVIQLGREPHRIDILTGISGVDFEEAWRNREAGDIAGTPVLFISRELLIKNKRAANRDKDQADIKLLENTRPRKP